MLLLMKCENSDYAVVRDPVVVCSKAADIIPDALVYGTQNCFITNPLP